VTLKRVRCFCNLDSPPRSDRGKPTDRRQDCRIRKTRGSRQMGRRRKKGEREERKERKERKGKERRRDRTWHDAD
jgi:hypothetical protein